MIQSEQFEQLLFLCGELLHLSWDVITDCSYSPGPLQCEIKYITLISFFSHHIPNDLDQQSCCAKKAGFTLSSMKKNMCDTQQLIISLYVVAMRPQVSTASMFAHHT